MLYHSQISRPLWSKVPNPCMLVHPAAYARLFILYEFMGRPCYLHGPARVLFGRQYDSLQHLYTRISAQKAQVNCACMQLNDRRAFAFLRQSLLPFLDKRLAILVLCSHWPSSHCYPPTPLSAASQCRLKCHRQMERALRLGRCTTQES